MQQPIEAGELNRRVAFQAQTSTQSATGSPAPSWSTVYACWASIDAQNSQLDYDTEQFIEQATLRIEIRYTSSIVFSAGMQIVYVDPGTGLSHTYQIKGVLNPRQANRKLVFLCYELQEKE